MDSIEVGAAPNSTNFSLVKGRAGASPKSPSLLDAPLQPSKKRPHTDRVGKNVFSQTEWI